MEFWNFLYRELKVIYAVSFSVKNGEMFVDSRKELMIESSLLEEKIGLQAELKTLKIVKAESRADFTSFKTAFSTVLNVALGKAAQLKLEKALQTAVVKQYKGK